MDKRGRDADKRYRSNKNSYKTITLTLGKEIINFLSDEVEKTSDKNMSRFIEDNLDSCSLEKMPKRRKFKTFPFKKTFTFTEKFVKIIKESGNMSLFVEKKLTEKFNLK